MAVSKFNAETTTAILESVRLGVTTHDAARAAGVSRRTIGTWITKGNKGVDGYVKFVADLKAAREKARTRVEPMSEAEHRLVVSESARNGSVQAMKLYDEMLQRDKAPDEPRKDVPADPLSGMDELARLRALRA